VDLAIVYGLLSAIAYGAADFLSQDAGRKVGAWRASFYYYILGFAALSLLISVQPSGWQHGYNAPLSAWFMSVGSGLLLLTAVVAFTQGLIQGQIAVVVPIMASYGAVTTLIALMAGEHLTARTVTGLTLTICGACGAAIPALGKQSHQRRSGAAWASVAALAYGIGFWLQGPAVAAMGPFLPVWAVYTTGMLIMILLHVSGAIDLKPPQDSSLIVSSVAAAILGVVAFVVLTLGLATGRPTVVVVVSSLASAVTVGLARLFNKVELAWHQWIAMASVILGLSLMNQ
jgi:drug/metabolite transporter (DMT)-like permease